MTNSSEQRSSEKFDVTAPLFVYAGIEAPVFLRCADKNIKEYIANKQIQAILLFDNKQKKDFIKLNEQNNLDFMDEVIGILARSRYRYLDYGVFATFRTNPKCRMAALRIEKGGVCLMGDLVALTEHEVQSRFRIDDDVLEAMKKHMANDKLRFNMRTPGWHGWAAPQRQR